MAKMSDAEWARMTGTTKKKPTTKKATAAKPAPKKPAPKKPAPKNPVKGAYATFKGRGKSLDEKIKKAGG